MNPPAAVIEAEAKAISARASGYKGLLSAATEPVAKAISAIAQAEAQKEVARQYAEAQKEVARQTTHQAAVRANPAILHELDGPIITISGDMGTKKKPQPYSASFSILGLFALGTLAELAFADMAAIENDKLPSNMNAQFSLIRTPRAEVKGTYVVSPTASGGSFSGDDKDIRVAKASTAWKAVQSAFGFGWLTQEQKDFYKKAIAGEYNLSVDDF
jgi:type II secretory pathway pseudopilin PulG